MTNLNQSVYKYSPFDEISASSERKEESVKREAIEVFTTEEIKVLSFLTGNNKEGRNFLAS